MSDESFFSRTVIVAAATGCLLIVSKTNPFTEPFFWVKPVVAKQNERSSRHVFLIAILFQLRKYSDRGAIAVNGACFNVNEG
jgi:hypothetical protein